MKLKTVIFGCLLSSFSVSAAEVVISEVKANKGRSVVAFDLISDGKVAGFNFALKVPGIDSKRVDLTSCTAQLPKGFDGACSVANGKVIVYAVGRDMNDVLPAGVNPIGKVVVTRGTVGSREKIAIDINSSDAIDITVDRLVVSSADAKRIESSAKVLSE